MKIQKELRETVCFTGHRSLSMKEHELQDKVLDLIQKAVFKGYTHFICGGAVGFDMLCAEQVLVFKAMYNCGLLPNMKPVTLEIAVPCNDQDKKYSAMQKKRYERILAEADIVHKRDEPYNRYCIKWRNQYMVSKSALVIAYFIDGRSGGTKMTLKMQTT